jgi:hypothetical protein
MLETMELTACRCEVLTATRLARLARSTRDLLNTFPANAEPTAAFAA